MLLSGRGASEEAVLASLEELPRCDDRVAAPLPPLTPCPGGCDEEAFCSPACAAAAWREHHALLCVGPVGRQAGGPLAAFLARSRPGVLFCRRRNKIPL